MQLLPEFTVSNEVRALGVRVICALITNLDNKKTDPKIEELRIKYAENLRSTLSPNFIKEDLVLCGFRLLHEKIGRSNRRYPSSPEALVNLFLSKGVIPKINPVVDIYNLISLDTRLALGAHDVSHIIGDVILRLTNGTERFVPLGASEPEPISSGEYCYVDDSNEILCRLEHKQVEKTKVTENTTSCFFIIQGNEATSPELIEEAFQRLSSLLADNCSGTLMKVWNESR